MANPIFNRMENEAGTVVLNSEPMTVNGAINKTLILSILLLMSSVWTWSLYFQGAIDKVNMLTIGGLVVGLISFIVIMFSRTAIRIAAPVYAIAEGSLIGGISAQFEKMFPGIVIQAVGATFLALFSMLFLYKIQAIKCNEKFMGMIVVVTVSICVVYMIEMIGSFFGLHIPGIFSSGLIGIGFSVIVCIIAALNLIIDFNNIELGAAHMMDKNYEWFGAFGLMVTLIWLYMEILNLLAKMNSRR